MAAFWESDDDARGFRFKVIENWDDTVDLCGKDRATGEGAEIGADATEVLTPTNEVDHVDLNDKRGDVKDVIANSIARITLSFEEFIRADTKNLDPAEVYAVVQAVPGLSENEQLKACAWLIENDKQFQMLKALPIKKKESMLLMFITRGE
ncbi:hypothetical protein CerSpe_213320 [Prunus speciosa]